jgi:hypothetical protein
MDGVIWARVFGIVEAWIAISILLALFFVAARHPQRIGRTGLFRCAYFLLALGIATPAVAELIFYVCTVEDVANSSLKRGDRFSFLMVSTGHQLGRLLLAFSVFCALASLDYKRREYTETGTPQR